MERTSGSGATGNVSTGGAGGSRSGGAGGIGGTLTAGAGGSTAQGGTGGFCVDEGCGPDGAACCGEGSGCGFAGPNGSMSCNCYGGRWTCTTSFGGIGGSAGFGGAGGCVDLDCGPQGAPCCYEGSGCGVETYSCACMRGQWQCTSNSGGTGGTGACNSDADCVSGLLCCAGRCVNTANDIYNCGGCLAPCGGSHPYCDRGVCGSPPCTSASPSPPGMFCCGNQYCATDLLCCDLQQSCQFSSGTTCYSPTAAWPACPPTCRAAE